MFRTDFNHWLQDFEGNVLTAFMEFISFLGLIYPLLTVAIFVLTIINFRKGLLLFNILAFTAMVTYVLKSTIDYPRPLAVDNELKTFSEKGTSADLTRLQPEGNFELFSPHLLENIRNSSIGRFGLPSGHTSMQVSLWMTLGLLFGGRKLWLAGIVMVTLTMISRMYLGLHYPGDILGGLFTGLACVAILLFIANHVQFLTSKKLNAKHLILLLIPILFIPVDNEEVRWQVGLILGANFSFVVFFYKKHLPHLSTIPGDRAFFFIILLFLFLSLFVVAKSASETLPFWMHYFTMFTASFAALSIAIKYSLKKKWLHYES